MTPELRKLPLQVWIIRCVIEQALAEQAAQLRSPFGVMSRNPATRFTQKRISRSQVRDNVYGIDRRGAHLIESDQCGAACENACGVEAAAHCFGRGTLHE